MELSRKHAKITIALPRYERLKDEGEKLRCDEALRAGASDSKSRGRGGSWLGAVSSGLRMYSALIDLDFDVKSLPEVCDDGWGVIRMFLCVKVQMEGDQERR